MQNDANSSFEQTGILKLNGLFRKLKPMLPIGPFHQAKSISFLQPLRPTEVGTVLNQDQISTNAAILQMIAHKNLSNRQLFMIGNRKWPKVTNTKKRWSHVGPSNWNFDFGLDFFCKLCNERMKPAILLFKPEPVDTKGLPFGILWDFSRMRQNATYLWMHNEP